MRREPVRKRNRAERYLPPDYMTAEQVRALSAQLPLSGCAESAPPVQDDAPAPYWVRD